MEDPTNHSGHEKSAGGRPAAREAQLVAGFVGESGRKSWSFGCLWPGDSFGLSKTFGGWNSKKLEFKVVSIWKYQDVY